MCYTVGPCWLSILNGIPYMWNLKRNYTNELSCKTKRLIDSENEFMVAGGGGRVRGRILGSLGWNCAHFYMPYNSNIV